MKKFSRFAFLSLAIAALLVPNVAFAQMSRTTGAVQGIITDTSGAVLPGVTVTATSPALQGSRVVVSDAKGEYILPSLPPGQYRVEYMLTGIKTVVRENVTVNLNQVTKVNVPLQMAVTETVTVTASQVVVDPTQTVQQTNFHEDHLKYATVGSANRSYQNVLQQAPGVAGGSNPQVSGANSAQNNYILDGINTTDPVTHTFGPNLAFDAIQEISIQTLGKDAEYSSSGGTVNVITKSGGNAFSGSADWRYNDKSLQQQSNKTRPVLTTASIPYYGAPVGQTTRRFDKNQQPTKSNQPQATFGGPVMKDRLWFFGAAHHPITQATPPNTLGFQPGTREFKGWNTLGKLTWTPVANQTLTGLYIDSHASIPHAEQDTRWSPEAGALQTQGTKTMGLTYDGILTSKWLLNAHVGHTPSRLGVFPMTGGGVIPVINLDTTVRSAAYQNVQSRTSNRDEVLGNTTYYLEGFGTHAIKGGFDWNKTKFTNEINASPGDPTKVTGATYDPTLCSPAFGFPAGIPCGALYIISGGVTFFELSPTLPAYTVGSKQSAIFVQDEWNPISRLTVRAGVRFEKVNWQAATNSPAPPNFSMTQPRLGIAYDIFNNASSVIHGYAGKIMDDNQLTLPNFGVNFPNGSYDFAIIGGKFLDAGGFIGTSGNQYASNLKPSYSNQASIGFTQKVFRNTSLDVTYETRVQKDLFEDYCGHLNTANNTYVYRDACIITNQPGFDIGINGALRSDYHGVTTKLESRAFNWLDVTASWVHSTSKGSTESTQNQNTAFDVWPVFFDNTYGFLSDDAKNRVKINGFVHLPLDFTLGVSEYWDDGTPWSVTQSSFTASATGRSLPPGYSSVTYFIEPRGSRRLPNFNQTDLQLQKDFRFGQYKVGVIGSVFNVFNSETVTSINGNAGSRAIAQNGQLFIGSGNLSNGQLYQQGGVNRLSSTFGQPNGFQRPRRYEVGVRFEF